jgi:hypothetical protein
LDGAEAKSKKQQQELLDFANIEVMDMSKLDKNSTDDFMTKKKLLNIIRT